MTLQTLLIRAVTPAIGIPGGEVRVECRSFVPDLPDRAQVLFGETRAEIASASADRLVLRIPEEAAVLGIRLRCGDAESEIFPYTVGTRIATGLHPVTSPVVGKDGSVITTISGNRGQQVPQPLVRVTRAGEKKAYGCEIVNPTGLAFGPDGQLYISSRNDGVVYRYNDFEELEPVAEDLGIACGLAFDSVGNLYVGDRSGRIWRLESAGSRAEFARLEPSIAAYHLAIDAADHLYVTAPSFSLRDSVFRISPEGRVEVLFSGLARPQGMAMDHDGSLLVTASWQGRKGLFKLSPATGEWAHHVAGPMLVGVAADADGLYLVDSTSVYWLPTTGAGRARIV